MITRGGKTIRDDDDCLPCRCCWLDNVAVGLKQQNPLVIGTVVGMGVCMHNLDAIVLQHVHVGLGAAAVVVVVVVEVVVVAERGHVAGHLHGDAVAQLSPRT